MNTVEAKITIVNKLGLHARAAARFVGLAGGFEATIQLSKGERKVDGKSIMGVMMLAAGKGSELILYATGNDSAAAITALSELVADRFGEEQ